MENQEQEELCRNSYGISPLALLLLALASQSETQLGSNHSKRTPGKVYGEKRHPNQRLARSTGKEPYFWACITTSCRSPGPISQRIHHRAAPFCPRRLKLRGE
jgi:hypothetical protein